MKHEDLIQELHDVARQLGVTVRYEKGDFEGGYCILKDEKLLLVNKRLLPNRKASVLALAIRELGLENIFLKPAVRQFIEDEVARATQSTTKVILKSP
jgi:murein endopeptidase